MSTVQESILSAVMNKQEWAQQVWEAGITPDHFDGSNRLAAEAAYAAYQKERTCEPQTVMAQLIAMGYARRFPGDRILTIYENGFPLSDAGFRSLIAALEEERQRREVSSLAQQLVQVAAVQDADFHLKVSDLATQITTSVQTRSNDPMEGTLTLQQLLDMDFPQAGEVVPGLFKARTRVVLTGPEGKGKSEMIYQIALGAARGVNPFTTEPCPPVRVLIVDAENEHVDLQKRLRRINALYDGLGAHPVEDNLRIQDALGWNLLDARDAGHLFALVRSFMPDLLVIGPVYQVMGGDANDAETVRRFMRVVDECRAISNTAVLTEAHAGHGEGGSRNGWRPSGSSLWLRWPDMGIGLDPADSDAAVMNLVRWRGDRIANDWPSSVRRGSLLPWQEVL